MAEVPKLVRLSARLYVTLSTAVLKLLFTWPWPYGLHELNGPTYYLPTYFLNTTKVTAPGLRSCLVLIKVRRDSEIC